MGLTVLGSRTGNGPPPLVYGLPRGKRGGEGAEFLTGLARQYRVREFVYAPAKFAQGGKRVSRRHLCGTLSI